MPRKRMIDPDFWSDEKLGNCKRDARLLFMGLISNADDEGYGRANSRLIKATIFPYDDDIKSEDIVKMLLDLKGMVYVFVADGQEFYFLPNFLKYQVINKPTPSKLPKMPDSIEKSQLPDSYGNDTVALPDDYSSTTVGLPPNRIEEQIKESKERKAVLLLSEFQNVQLTDVELQKLYERFGQSLSDEAIEQFGGWMKSTGKSKKDHYATLVS